MKQVFVFILIGAKITHEVSSSESLPKIFAVVLILMGVKMPWPDKISTANRTDH
jgi:uncharacterized membrane protein YfcA